VDWAEKVVSYIWSGVQVIGNRMNLFKHLCPKKRGIWLKLLDEVRGTRQAKQVLNHDRSCKQTVENTS